MIRPTPRAALAGALLLYVAWTRVLCIQVLGRFARALPADVADPLLNATILAWNSRHLPLTDAWWQFPNFAPSANATAFTEHLLATWPVASPVMWVTGNPIAAYNVVFVASFLFGAVAMYALAWHLTRHALASFVAGFAFGFPLYAAVQVSHVQVLITGWMPLTLLALHKWLDGGRWWWALAAGVSWLMTALTNAYYLVFFGVFLAGWFLYFGLRRDTFLRAVSAGAVLLVCLAPAVPLFLKYIEVHQTYGFARSVDEIRFYSADVLDLFDSSDRLTLWGPWLSSEPKESQLFPGVAILFLAAAALFGRRVPAADMPAVARHGQFANSWRHVLLVPFAVAVVAGLIVMSRGPWRASLLGARVSLSTVERPFTIAFWAVLLWVALAPRVRAAWRRADAVAFYTAAAFATWVLALGPAPTLGGRTILEQGPYAWLMRLPGGDAVRVPARYWVLTILCLSVLAAFGVVRLAGRTWGRRVGLVLLTVLLVAESHFLIKFAALPYGVTDSDVRDGTSMVVELPLGSFMRDIRVQYRAVLHGYRSMNGYSGYFPPHYTPLVYGLAYFRPGMLDPFRERGPVLAVVADEAPGPNEVLAYLRVQPGVESIRKAAHSTLVLLPQIPPQPPPELGRQLPVSDVSVSVSRPDIPAMFDANVRTRWNTGIQNQDDEVRIDLGSRQPIGAVVLELGAFSSSYPRHLAIAVSPDGTAWQPAWDGPVEALVVRAALRDPVAVPVVVPLAGIGGRFVRIRQTGRHPEYSWSIAELKLYAPR